MRISHILLCQLCAGIAFALQPLFAGAQTYPNKTIRVIVPITPGGGQDFVARLITSRAERRGCWR
jgi:tripartite-type tricarboxylate transporter receptor subunit TctC